MQKKQLSTIELHTQWGQHFIVLLLQQLLPLEYFTLQRPLLADNNHASNSWRPREGSFTAFTRQIQLLLQPESRLSRTINMWGIKRADTEYDFMEHSRRDR